jgi:SAM-dependent methyltransferase
VFLREKFDYYDPEFNPGKIKQGAEPRKYSDIQQLSFAEATFDLIIASEVFEHVREDVKGFQEVYRTLKPEGTFILTVPYDHQRAQTEVRVEVQGDRDIFLAPPHYHGGSGATLEYRQYGRDLLERLRAVGFTVGYFESEIPRYQIPKFGVIICRKSHYFDFGQAWQDAGGNEALPRLGPLLPFRLFVLYKFNLKSFFHYLREIKSKIAAR